jgi:hypothetical protein
MIYEGLVGGRWPLSMARLGGWREGIVVGPDDEPIPGSPECFPGDGTAPDSFHCGFMSLSAALWTFMLQEETTTTRAFGKQRLCKCSATAVCVRAISLRGPQLANDQSMSGTSQGCVCLCNGTEPTFILGLSFGALQPARALHSHPRYCKGGSWQELDAGTIHDKHREASTLHQLAIWHLFSRLAGHQEPNCSYLLRWVSQF